MSICNFPEKALTKSIRKFTKSIRKFTEEKFNQKNICKSNKHNIHEDEILAKILEKYKCLY